MAHWLTWVAIVLVAITPLAEAKANAIDEKPGKEWKDARKSLRDAVAPPHSAAPGPTPVPSPTSPPLEASAPDSPPPQDEISQSPANEPAPTEGSAPSPPPETEASFSHATETPARNDPSPVAPTALPWSDGSEENAVAAATTIQPRGNESLFWFILPFAALVSVGAVFLEQVRRKQPVRGATQPPGDTRMEEPGVPAVLRLAQAAVARGDIQDALKWFDTVLIIDPGLAVAHFCRGVCLESTGAYEEAHVSLLRALGDNDVDLSARFHLARVAVRTGRHREAMDALSTLLTRLPEAHPRVVSEPVFERLADHPRFLMLVGRL